MLRPLLKIAGIGPDPVAGRRRLARIEALLRQAPARTRGRPLDAGDRRTAAPQVRAGVGPSREAPYGRWPGDRPPHSGRAASSGYHGRRSSAHLHGQVRALRRRPVSPYDESDFRVASTNDLKNGMVLNIDGQLWSVVEFQHVKPGKGPAFVRTKLKNVLSGKVVDKTFNAGTKVETANVDKRDMQYLYKDGTDFVFMDGDTYDQIHVGRGRRRRRRQLHAGEPERDRRHPRRRRRCTSSCPPPSCSRSPTPSRACRATAPPAAPSRRRSRPARRSPSRCSSRPAPRSRSTPATAPTSAASADRTVLPDGGRTKARKRALDLLFEADQRGVNAADAAAPSGWPRRRPRRR